MTDWKERSQQAGSLKKKTGFQTLEDTENCEKDFSAKYCAISRKSITLQPGSLNWLFIFSGESVTGCGVWECAVDPAPTCDMCLVWKIASRTAADGPPDHILSLRSNVRPCSI